MDNKNYLESPAFLHHLTFLQNIISRMGHNSFVIKAVTMTIIGAMVGFITDLSYYHLMVEIFIILMLAILDAYYLRLERFFRESYLHLVKNVSRISMNRLLVIKVDKRRLKLISWCDVFFSISIIGYYLPLVIMCIVLFIMKKG